MQSFGQESQKHGRERKRFGETGVQGEAGLQREREVDRDLATSEFYHKVYRGPRQGFKEENDQLHVLEASLL